MRKGILGLIVSIGLVYAQTVIAADAPSKSQKAPTKKVAVEKDVTEHPKHHPRHHAKHHHRHHHHTGYYSDDYCDDDHYYHHHHRHHHKHHGAKHVENNPAAKPAHAKKSSQAKPVKQKQTNFHTQPSSKQIHTSYNESNTYKIEKREISSGLERSHR
jgi:hypothetical protein